MRCDNCYVEPTTCDECVSKLRGQLAESSNVRVHLEEQIQVMLAHLAEAQAKAQALDWLEEIAAKHHRTLVIFSVGEKAIIDINAPTSNYPELRQEFSVESITKAWERSKP